MIELIPSPSGGSWSLVVDRGHVVGIVTARDISRLIDVHTLAGRASYERKILGRRSAPAGR
jgi:hypothetical protein